MRHFLPYLIGIPVLEEVWAEFNLGGFSFISLFANNLVSNVTSTTSEEVVRQGHAQEMSSVFWGLGEGRLMGRGSRSIS